MFLKNMFLFTVFFFMSNANAQDYLDHTKVSLSWLFLKPYSSNHAYASLVSGTQPYYQNWHLQVVNPNYSSAFEVALQSNILENILSGSASWLHFNSNDSNNVQGNSTLNDKNIAFVGPLFEMSPPVFGIRRADAQLKYNYDDINLNLEKLFSNKTNMLGKLIGGLKVLSIKQTFTTVFSDLVGALPTPYSYALSPDPSYTFQIQSISSFIGLGPDLGLNGEIEIGYGFSLIGNAMGSLSVGTSSIQEKFQATSERLTNLGIGTSYQQITTPNKTQLIPGFDGKLGVAYKFEKKQSHHFKIEAGYRLLSYINAISTTAPQTLVQPGTEIATPEFSTGTMAIVSVTQQDRPFNLNGAYITFSYTHL